MGLATKTEEAMVKMRGIALTGGRFDEADE
jgi:hypothetical protein